MEAKLTCNSCYNHIQSHSCYLSCCICKAHYHLQCLPNISKNDSLYINRLSNNWICINCCEHLFPFNHHSEHADFIKCISESSICNSDLTLTYLETQSFNPLN